MERQLEKIAQNLSEKFNLKLYKHGSSSSVPEELVKAKFELFETFLEYEFNDFSCEPFDSEHSDFTEKLLYQENRMWIYLDRSSEEMRLSYSTASEFYPEIVERLKLAGSLGERLLAAQRSGNPEIVSSVYGFINIGNLEGIEKFFYNFIHKKK